ncbi:MAG: hypothetical protein WAJ85_08680 [Candidatus Baltobacteraceae bacterium]|jgi:uncharacterized protein YuzE
MPRLPIGVEREAEHNVACVRYGQVEREGVGRTVGYADYRVNVDVDQAGGIVGIEILSLGFEELAALAEIAKAHDLDLSPLIGGTVPSAA